MMYTQMTFKDRKAEIIDEDKSIDIQYCRLQIFQNIDHMRLICCFDFDQKLIGSSNH